MNKNFICATYEYCGFEKYIPAPYMRKSFMLDDLPQKAEISICGLGFYVLYINGKNITKGALAPYISNPDHYCYYDTYDLSGLLNKGENVIGIILGNGFYNSFGGSVWDFEKAQWRNSPCVALELSLDGSVAFCADESFRVKGSPIIFDELRMGEYYDSRLEIPNWNLAGFDDSDWNNAMLAPTPRGELRECTAEPIRVSKKLKPVKISKQDDGYVYDFGENNAGLCTLKIRAEKGQKIELRYGEEIRDGKFDIVSTIFDRPDTQFYKEYSQKDIYIAKGEGVEEYTQQFTYHGFRYVYVKGINDSQATDDLLTYNIMSSDLTTIGGFSCSDDVANKVFEITKRSDISNFYYFQTDCPHREKNGWLGDASLSADHVILTFDVEKSWTEWLRNICKAQDDEGKLPGIVPTDKWGFEWGNGPWWDSCLFNLSYQLYKVRGNTEIIKEISAAMVKYFDYILKVRNADGTVSVGLGDWLPIGKICDEYDVPVEVTDTIAVMDMAKKASEMFGAVGYRHQADFAANIYNDFRQTIREKLLDKETLSIKGDSQSGQALGLYYGVFEPNEEQAAFDRLMEYIEQKNNNFDCGMLGMHVLFHILTRFGQSELAYEMITKKEYPSYAHLLEQGETTLVEYFHPDDNELWRGSHNHHLFGDVNRWFINCVAGLNVINPKYVEIKPNFIKKLESASAFYELPGGRVKVSWERKGQSIILDAEHDENISCKIILPEGYTEKDVIIRTK